MVLIYKYCLVQNEKNCVNENDYCDFYLNDDDGDDDVFGNDFVNCSNVVDVEVGCLIGEVVVEVVGLLKGVCLFHRVLFSMKEVCLLKCIYDHLHFPLKKH